MDSPSHKTAAPEPWVNAATVAAHLGFESDHIRKMARANRLPGVQVQNGAKAHWRFKLSEVDAFLDRASRSASIVSSTVYTEAHA